MKKFAMLVFTEAEPLSDLPGPELLRRLRGRLDRLRPRWRDRLAADPGFAALMFRLYLPGDREREFVLFATPERRTRRR